MRSWISVALFNGIALSAQAQPAPSSAGAGTPPLPKVEDEVNNRGIRLKPFPRNILQDPAHILWRLPVSEGAIRK